MEEWIDEIVADLASGLIDASDEEITAKLDEYGLSDEDKADVLETIKQVKEAEGLADENPDPLSLENVDAMADAQAQQMADEDNTEVTVTSEDKDGDGDADKVTAKKEKPEDDNDSDEGNSDESDDKPHDEDTVVSDARMKNIIGTLSQFKY